jgi:hypothetical protein
MDFREFLTEDNSRAKLGTLPSLADCLGQYPPLYVSPKAADFITYFTIHYPDGIKMKSHGVVDPADMMDIHHHVAPKKIHWNPIP